MKIYYWNKFWLWLARFALFRTCLFDFPCYGRADEGLGNCQEFNEVVFADQSSAQSDCETCANTKCQYHGYKGGDIPNTHECWEQTSVEGDKW